MKSTKEIITLVRNEYVEVFQPPLTILNCLHQEGIITSKEKSKAKRHILFHFPNVKPMYNTYWNSYTVVPNIIWYNSVISKLK
jgi:hypothetical protein